MARTCHATPAFEALALKRTRETGNGVRLLDDSTPREEEFLDREPRPSAARILRAGADGCRDRLPGSAAGRTARVGRRPLGVFARFPRGSHQRGAHPGPSAA